MTLLELWERLRAEEAGVAATDSRTAEDLLWEALTAPPLPTASRPSDNLRAGGKG